MIYEQTDQNMITLEQVQEKHPGSKIGVFSFLVNNKPYKTFVILD